MRSVLFFLILSFLVSPTSAYEFYLTINVTSGDFSKPIIVGFSTNASDTYGSEDVLSPPPPPFSFKYAYIFLNDLMLDRDIRKTINTTEIEIWEIVVYSDENISLKWNPQKIPSSYSFYLILGNNSSVYMNENDHVNLAAGHYNLYIFAFDPSSAVSILQNPIVLLIIVLIIFTFVTLTTKDR